MRLVRKLMKDRDSLQSIPGVGPAVAKLLREVNVNQVSDLKGQDAHGSRRERRKN